MLEQADVVLCATGARTPLLGVADLEEVMARRDRRALTIVDLSLPRNVEPAARYVPESSTSDALVDAVTELLTSAEARSAILDRAPEVLARYDWTAAAAATLAAIDEGAHVG